ncbi:adhesin [uncultured Methanobrevibacter sp.]|uniref:adhesin n=1 Tax=uncultured Methanobrevibacter sp. TaxID=253161 RepID=UPI0025FFAF9A|nr:adhesin [uncultured Methanobrevibacter sp.]
MNIKKIATLFILLIILLAPTLSAVSATNVFLTSDTIFGQKGEEVKMLNEIKTYIEEEDSSINVTVDSESPGPGEGTRAMVSDSDVSVAFAFADAANFYELAKYSTKVDKQVIYVNVGSLDLYNLTLLRRAWDDNWSDKTFLSLKNPGNFLSKSGVTVIQPVQALPGNTDKDGDMYYSDSEKNKYIASQIVEAVHNYNSSNKNLREGDIIRTELDVSVIGDISQGIIINQKLGQENAIYAGYTGPQALYLLSSYLSGEGLNKPGEFSNPSSPQDYSVGTPSSYSVYDYEEMGGIVKNYMDKNGRAPDSIQYKGASIGYNDLLYNFALLTEDDKDASSMNLPKTSEFKSSNDMTLFFIAIAIIAIIGVILLYIGIRKRRR